MVSLRCKMIVKESLLRLKLDFSEIDLGLVETPEDVSSEDRDKLKKLLHKSGMVLLNDEQSLDLNKIKELIRDMIYYSDDVNLANYPDYISEKLGHEYSYLSRIFAETRGIDIKHYITCEKVERVKELILYDELNLKQIALKLKYRNVTQLSKQFKSVTGLTPAYFKKLKRMKKQITSGKL